MRKNIVLSSAFVAALSVLSGCQDLLTKPQLNNEFNGYLEEPITPFIIELKPTQKYLYKKEINFGDGIGTGSYYTKENIKEKSDFLIKRSKIELKELLQLEYNVSVEVVLHLLPNGIVTKVDVDEFSFIVEKEGKQLKTKTFSDYEKAKYLKRNLLKYFEKTEVFGFVKRYPDYALGQIINVGFKSKCWREEQGLEKIIISTVDSPSDRKILNSDISATSKSECSFIGLTYIDGRKSAVFKEQVYSTFKIKGNSNLFSASYSGWRALDIDKGLLFESETTVA